MRTLVPFLLLSTLCGCAAATSPAGTTPQAAAPVTPTSSQVFVCSDAADYVVRAESERAWLFRRKGTLELPAVPAASGAKYSDGQVTLWITGDQARLEEADAAASVCHNDTKLAAWEKAKLDGVGFRAVGNEPSWTLEMVAGATVTLVTDYGQTRTELPLPVAQDDQKAKRTIWRSEAIMIEATAQRCVDTMSGDAFPSRVRVWWKDRVLSGCGQALH